ncbi:hypothetical protein BCR44DRAFT_122013 [Catenaria anguillulae PL171]|uniref:Fe2OG dioxygenase domain-containing protein n=1 Tax=Catenaria anguillulae PL171 TaxID=765915 RepID=A0A1Y2HPA6_9FUNG|nr:hypothetical protein BCR44DRAFT_122013 [Catenaria anguillulae PL171]
MPSESPAKEISELLKVPVQFAGEYTFGGAATTLPSIPGLDVNGYGPLTVPLVDPAQTERLIARSLEINATAADPEELCVTWQLDATQVTITNKAWETGLAQLVATVADRLGCRHVPLSANLARLLVCGPGSIISCGEDVAVKSRKFATLFIQLPSAHEGGDLVVSEPDGTAVTFDFGAADGTSPFSPQYALFYDNAEHAFKPITSGYRIALVYSICWPEGHKQIDLLESLPTLRQLGNHLSTLGKEHRSFFFTLSQKHEPTTLGRQRIKALMGQDFARSNMIRAANAMLGESSAFTLYLVQSVRDVHNGPDLMRFRQSYPLWIDMETGKQYSSAQENINIGAMINPDGKSDEDLWSVEKKRLSGMSCLCLSKIFN